MSTFFYVAGSLMSIGGLAWSALATIAGSDALATDTPNNAFVAAMAFGAAAPGVATVIAGLVFVAIGRVLDLLARIARNIHAGCSK